jgi:hypothetical protein
VCQYAFPLDPSKLVVTADWDSIQFEAAKSITVTAVYQYTPILAGALGMPNITINLRSQSTMTFACCVGWAASMDWRRDRNA